MEAGYINGEKFKNLPLVDDCEIIKEVFEACPQIIGLDLLYLDMYGMPEYMNAHIVDLLECYQQFKSIIDREFIEVVEDSSFDYEYGDICSTHHCVTRVGYVRRTPEMMEIISYPWDMEFY